MLRSASSRVEFPGYRAVFTVWLVPANKKYCEVILFSLLMVYNYSYTSRLCLKDNDFCLFIFIMSIVIFYQINYYYYCY